MSVLISTPRRSYLENELARESGSSVSEINRQMGDLVSSGLVTMQKVGKAKVYRINERHFLHRPMKRLFRDLQDVYREIALNLVSQLKKHEPKAVILFGSLSKGKIRSDLVEEPSDIDILVVADQKDVAKIRDEMLRYINLEVSLRYGIAVYPIVLSVEDYLKGLKEDQLIIGIHAKGEVLYGEKPTRFS
ncbi:MAG: nucleotidyltransferase domain-containing protein [Thaumarchaeota archaeon]|nr:nucleotidyltransferase domain-containing protein [Nitrososphaerota archaeon]